MGALKEFEKLCELFFLSWFNPNTGEGRGRGGKEGWLRVACCLRSRLLVFRGLKVFGSCGVDASEAVYEVFLDLLNTAGHRALGSQLELTGLLRAEDLSDLVRGGVLQVKGNVVELASGERNANLKEE